MAKDILLLTRIDYANTGFRFMRSLQTLGLDCGMVKRYPHILNYPDQAEQIADRRLIVQRSKLYKAIHYIASQFVSVPLSGKRVVVQHGGSRYRTESDSLNTFFNPIVDATVVQTPDLLGLGAKNEHYIVSPVDVGFLAPVFARCDPHVLHVGHFPSSPEVKGTSTILSVIDRLAKVPGLRPFKYVGIDGSSDECLSWLDHLERVRRCDILIETCNETLGGRPFGEWGNAALEAAALGKIVVTNCHSQAVYESVYGPLGLQVANDEAALLSTLTRLLSLDDGELQGLREETRAWVERNHSLEATGKRLWSSVYRHLLGDST